MKTDENEELQLVCRCSKKKLTVSMQKFDLSKMDLCIQKEDLDVEFSGGLVNMVYMKFACV